MPEPGSELVATLDSLTVSALARVEVPSALWRKARAEQLDPTAAERVLRAFVIDLMGRGDHAPRFGAVGLDQAILDRAAAAVADHRLRAYDAVQLATAIRARDADPECRTFACFDGDLRTAASASGFELVP